jgi:hypothetical protein
MSAAEDRQAIADAANTVDGINCSAYSRQLEKTGDALVRYSGQLRDENGFGFVVTWDVFVVLPADLKAAEQWLDSNLTTLLEALEEEMTVDSVTPAEITYDTGTARPGVAITGFREN